MDAGDFVNSSIRLLRLLGQGGMGSVWVAEHLKLQTEVVVKFITGEYAKHPEALARFEREAALTAQAKSPHVVQVLDHGIARNGLPYVAMEFLEGEDLGARIAREHKIAPTQFAEWLRQAASGLSRAHAKGIVHRDIKPENIFLCNEDGEVLVKLLDFGIAKSDSVKASFSGTQTGAVLGTAFYMSPEQTMGAKNIDHRSDLWALGVVSYYALTGVRPFDRDAIGPLVMAITSDPIAPPSQHEPSLSPAIDAWMAKALARSVDDRFQSAKEMAIALSQAVFGENQVRLSDFGTQLTGAPPQASAARGFNVTTLSPAVTAGEGGDFRAFSWPIKPTWRRAAIAMAGGVLVALMLVLFLDTGSSDEVSGPSSAAVVEDDSALLEQDASELRISAELQETLEKQSPEAASEKEPTERRDADPEPRAAEQASRPHPEVKPDSAPKPPTLRPSPKTSSGAPALRMDLE